MGERTSHTPGTFSWTDLATPDLEGAHAFYVDLFGWEHEDFAIAGGGVYRMYRENGKDVAAASAAQEGQHPAWLSYVTVEDVDAAAQRAGELGATVMLEPFDVMDAGRMALLQDPTGAVFAVWQAKDNIGAGLVNGPGRLTLNQLNTSDPERAQQFYADLFGWRSERMAEGDRPYWGLYNGETVNGGMTNLPEGAEMPSHWLVYFGTADIDAANDRITASGGTVIVPKMPVPGGEILVAQDPQGAIFALFAGRFDD
jgi:predicted enzyme related to lactoylglutathione lyase